MKHQQLAEAIHHPAAQGQDFLTQAQFILQEYPALEPLALSEQINLALSEIGIIEPWWSEADQMFVFEHEAYPACVHADPEKQKAVEGYLRALSGWIAARMHDQVADFMHHTTRGHGGRRLGAGRPRVKPTRMKRLPADVAEWLSREGNLAKLRALMGESA